MMKILLFEAHKNLKYYKLNIRMHELTCVYRFAPDVTKQYLHATDFLRHEDVTIKNEICNVLRTVRWFTDWLFYYELNLAMCLLSGAFIRTG